MPYYKGTISKFADAHQLATTTDEGPLVAWAVNEGCARCIFGMNFGIAASRWPDGRIPIIIWSDISGSVISEIARDESELVPRTAMFGGYDLAGHFIDYADLTFDGEVQALMIWWPCSPDDICPH